VLRGERADRPTNADRLASYLQERYERYGDLTDGRDAAHWATVAADDAGRSTASPSGHARPRTADREVREAGAASEPAR
jgi:hypothetical protein